MVECGIRGDHESLLKKNEYWSFIAYLDEPPIGYAIVFKRKFEENAFRKNYTALVIDQMCVIDEFQHQGVGSQLVSEVRGFAKKMGVDKLELTVWSKNKEARAFYHRIGFNTILEYRLRRGTIQEQLVLFGVRRGSSTHRYTAIGAAGVATSILEET